ncbi:MAG TPA: DUF4326 domain-containing protein [Jatrophihabitans sp.]|jgi:hypothetical protein|nr:DUF4326 domain-containing protein [Jatrophihabitans sp.]
MPKRIQLRRTQGWRKPEGTIVVARPSRWGNPFRIGPAGEGGLTREQAVRAFAQWLRAHPDHVRAVRAELAGHDLACWCPLDAPCHADVLLQVANE